MEKQQHPETRRAVTRRTVLQSAAALATARTVAAQTPTAKTTLVYIGGYTDAATSTRFEVSKGTGIYLYVMDPASGFLTLRKSFDVGNTSPSSIVISPSGKYLYAVNEISNFNGMQTGSVTAYSITTPSGDIKMLNAVASGGTGPAFVGIDPTGKYVFAANYGGGNFSVFPVLDDGSLGQASDTQAGKGPLFGPHVAVNAPIGSFANSGHDTLHAHMTQTDPSGKFLLVTDLGLDQLMVFKLDNGKVTPTEQGSVRAIPGAGPRHFAFHQNGKWLYLINEEASSLTFMLFDPATGKLTPKSTIWAVPDNFQGTNYPGELIISANGKFVYASNRLYNTIATFSVDQATGDPVLIGNEWTRGDYPRTLGIDPSGQYMYALHSRSDNITGFRIGSDGKPVFTGQFVGVGNPSGIAFLLV
jgi:6-phosphogluconolactonase (cycloisomerase 2 family)